MRRTIPFAADIAALQAILRHKTVARTRRYSHLMTEHLHRAMSRYGSAAETDTNTGTGHVGNDDRPPAGNAGETVADDAPTINPGR